MSKVKIGTAKYGFTQKKYAKLKDGENTYRILPPLGDLADKGIWSVFYSIHYGYKNTKGKLRIFQSSLKKNGKSKMIEIPDAAAARIDDLKAKLEDAKKAGNTAITERLGPLVSGKKPMYNLDKNHHMNAIDTQGNIVILKLRHRAKQALDAEIKSLREKGVDPLSVDNGRFFVITRTGSGLDTAFSVKIMQEKMNIQGVGEVNRDVVHKLSDELINRLGDEAAQLDKLYKALTAEEIERVVKTSELSTGQSSAIDELFDSSDDGPSGNDAGGDDDEPENATSSTTVQASSTTTTQTQQASAPAPTPASTSPAPAAAPVENTAAAKASSQVAQAEAATSPTPATTAVAPTTTSNPLQTTGEKVNEMSDADFLKSLGL